VFIKLKHNTIVAGFSPTQKYIILFYLDDDMFRSLDHHKAIFTKLRIRYMQCTASTLLKKARIKLLFITHNTNHNGTNNKITNKNIHKKYKAT
jgi:hypothetical protein